MCTCARTPPHTHTHTRTHVRMYAASTSRFGFRFPAVTPKANTHLPEVVGVARGWEVEGNLTLQTITRNFFSILEGKYSYATGGSNVNEYWANGNQLGDAIKTNVNQSTAIASNSNGFHTEETCSVYNQLKVVRHMLTWLPSVVLADAYEKMLFNGM